MGYPVRCWVVLGGFSLLKRWGRALGREECSGSEYGLCRMLCISLGVILFAFEVSEE